MRFECSAEHCLVVKQPDHAEQSARSSEASMFTSKYIPRAVYPASNITTAPRCLERSEMAKTRLYILDYDYIKRRKIALKHAYIINSFTLSTYHLGIPLSPLPYRLNHSTALCSQIVPVHGAFNYYDGYSGG